MPKYDVTYKCIARYRTTIEADNEEEAKQKLYNGDFWGADFIEDSIDEIESIKEDE